MKRDQLPVADRCSANILLQAAAIARITGNVENSKWFLLWHGRQGYWGSEIKPLSADEAELAEIQELKDSPHMTSLIGNAGDSTIRKAVRWITEWLTFHWVMHLNAKGIAPSSADVRERYVELVPHNVQHHLESDIVSLRNSVSVQKKWAAAFRKHWTLKHRMMAIGHVLADDEIKVRVLIYEKSRCESAPA